MNFDYTVKIEIPSRGNDQRFGDRGCLAGRCGKEWNTVNVVKEEVGAVCVVKRLQMRMKGV